MQHDAKGMAGQGHAAMMCGAPWAVSVEWRGPRAAEEAGLCGISETVVPLASGLRSSTSAADQPLGTASRGQLCSLQRA